MRRLKQIAAISQVDRLKRKRRLKEKTAQQSAAIAKAVKNSLSNTGLDDWQALQNSLMYRFEGSEGLVKNERLERGSCGMTGIKEETSSYLENLILKNAKRIERSNRINA